MVTVRAVFALLLFTVVVFGVSDTIMVVRLLSLERKATETREEQLKVKADLMKVNEALSNAVELSQQRREAIHFETSEQLDRIERLLER